MAAAEDCSIWEFAKSGDFSIASKDGDFHQLSLVRGAPPKVIWLRVGNASTDLVAQLIRSHFDEIEAFNIGEGSLLVLDL